MKMGRVVAEPGKPLQFVDAVGFDAPRTPAQDDAMLIARALAAYAAAARGLLQGKYASLASIAPRHLREEGNISVLRCTDGVLVRYDAAPSETATIRAGTIDQRLAELAPAMSERVLHIDVDAGDVEGNEDGIRFEMGVVDQSGATTQAHTMSVVLLASSKLPEGCPLPSPPARPICLVSVQSEIELQVAGYVLPVDEALRPDTSGPQKFIAQSRVQLPVGWTAIEIYPLLGAECWRTEFAPMWAELDILATAARRNLHEANLSALDSRWEVRERYSDLLDEFARLLEGPEEPVHQFLRQHPELISPACDRYWSKLPFGARVSDFVFREPHNDYELVELEAPIRSLFRKDGQQRQELTHAFNQIADWLQYIEDNRQGGGEKSRSDGHFNQSQNSHRDGKVGHAD